MSSQFGFVFRSLNRCFLQYFLFFYSKIILYSIIQIGVIKQQLPVFWSSSISFAFFQLFYWSSSFFTVFISLHTSSTMFIHSLFQFYGSSFSVRQWHFGWWWSMRLWTTRAMHRSMLWSTKLPTSVACSMCWLEFETFFKKFFCQHYYNNFYIAHQTCCHQCQIRSAGHICRQVRSVCGKYFFNFKNT